MEMLLRTLLAITTNELGDPGLVWGFTDHWDVRFGRYKEWCASVSGVRNRTN